MAPGKECRFCPRARLDRPLMAEFHHAYRIPVRDLSLTGAFLAEELPFRVGQEVHLTIWLSDSDAIEVEAVVRRAPKGKGLGVEFVSLTGPASTRLRDYLHTARLQSG
ncbi:MAG: PilZ domain-containing protein [Candidatus Acidoferrales bacterium]